MVEKSKFESCECCNADGAGLPALELANFARWLDTVDTVLGLDIDRWRSG